MTVILLSVLHSDKSNRFMGYRKMINHNDEFIRQCLFEALHDLMQESDFDDITVDRIVKRAHVSRPTFYRRYRDKDDLLNSSYEKILEDTLFKVYSGVSWRDAVTMIYQVIGEHAPFFHNAFRSKSERSLRRFIFERTLRLESEILKDHGVDIDDPNVQYRLRAYVAGGLELTVLWVKENAVFPVQDLVDILVEIVPRGYEQYFV